MQTGLTGDLDVRYSQVVGPRNGWLGGDGDSWERGLYWVDGLLPLAYILNDPALIEKVKPWVEWTLTHQRGKPAEDITLIPYGCSTLRITEFPVVQ